MRIPQLPVTRRLASLAEDLASVRALADTRLHTVKHLQSQVDELREGLPLDDERGRSGNFVGGHWTEVNKQQNANADIIQLARARYHWTSADRAGLRRPYGTSRRVVDMHGEYCFGGGVEAPTVQADAGDADAEAIDEALREFWFYPPNQESCFSMAAQQELSSKLLVDGTLYFAMFEPTAGRPMLIRLLEPLEFGQAVTAPDDASKVLYHVRRYTPSKWSVQSASYLPTGEEHVLYYKDIDAESSDDIDDPYAEQLADKIAKDRFGHPIKVLKVGDGHSLMFAMSVWEKEFNKVAADQVTLSASTAAMMNHAVVQGDQSDVDAVVAYLGQSGSDPTTAPKVAGDWTVTNDAVKLDISRASFGANEANHTRRILHMSLATIGGVSLHYIGDPENANLATATAMEGPQLKHFEAYQGLWVYILRRLAMEAVKEYQRGRAILSIHIPMPDLVERDIMDTVDALKVANDEGWATDEQCALQFWTAIGAADPSAEAEKATEEADENGMQNEDSQEQEEVANAPLPMEPPRANPIAVA